MQGRILVFKSALFLLTLMVTMKAHMQFVLRVVQVMMHTFPVCISHARYHVMLILQLSIPCEIYLWGVSNLERHPVSAL